MVETILRAAGLHCERRLAREDVSRVCGAGLSLARGEQVALCGPSGCGKILLLHMLGLLERPDAGELEVLGLPVLQLDDAERGKLRNRHFGFIFEAPHLLPSFSVAENIAMPFFKITGVDLQEAGERTTELLALVGLSDAEKLPVHHLDLEEQFRVSLVRALIHGPSILLGEEPSMLETAAARQFSLLALRLAAQMGVSVVWAFPSLVETERVSGVRALQMERGAIPYNQALLS